MSLLYQYTYNQGLEPIDFSGAGFGSVKNVKCSYFKDRFWFLYFFFQIKVFIPVPNIY